MYLRTNDIPKINISAEYNNVKMTVARLFHELVARGELTVNDQEKVFDIEKTINYRR